MIYHGILIVLLLYSCWFIFTMLYIIPTVNSNIFIQFCFLFHYLFLELKRIWRTESDEWLEWEWHKQPQLQLQDLGSPGNLGRDIELDILQILFLVTNIFNIWSLFYLRFEEQIEKPHIQFHRREEEVFCSQILTHLRQRRVTKGRKHCWTCGRSGSWKCWDPDGLQEYQDPRPG